MTIAFERWPGPALAYHVLAHLPLESDAASLHDVALPERDWIQALHAAYDSAPDRLQLQGLGLLVRSVDELRRAVASLSPGLAAAATHAVEAEREAFERAFDTEASAGAARASEVRGAIAPRLEQLRDALWERQGPRPPPLRILDCRNLGRAGRASRDGDTHVVAVSLAQPPIHVLLQVLHEEIHPISDPAVHAGSLGGRDTRAGTAGHRLHATLENAAIEVGRALIAARTPDLIDEYEGWCAAFG